MKVKLLKKGFNYSQDGNGNRLVLHLQGCNMHCPWCSNPESMDTYGTLMVLSEKLLDELCPNGAISQGVLNRNLCYSCVSRECLSTNRNSMLKLSCSVVEIDDLVMEAVKSRPLFFDNGGVTLTGGEPTLQFNSIYSLLEKLKERGIHTAIETNGTNPKLKELFPIIDLLIIDFKHYDDTKHKSVLGISNTIIKENLAYAFSEHPNVWIRTPLVDGFNASEDDIIGFLDFYTKYDTSHASFELLRYHEYGKIKWKQCGMEYTVNNGFISDSCFAKFETAYQKAGLNVIHT